jgi:hypothetical protein
VELIADLSGGAHLGAVDGRGASTEQLARTEVGDDLPSRLEITRRGNWVRAGAGLFRWAALLGSCWAAWPSR